MVGPEGILEALEGRVRTVVGMEADKREVRMAGPRLPVAPARATEGMVDVTLVVMSGSEIGSEGDDGDGDVDGSWRGLNV